MLEAEKEEEVLTYFSRTLQKKYILCNYMDEVNIILVQLNTKRCLFLLIR